MARNARAIVLLGMYGLFSLVVLLIVGSISRAVQGQLQGFDKGQGEGALEAYSQARRGLVGLLFSTDPAFLEALQQVPLVVLIVFKVSLFFLPAYVALMGFDQISGELATRSIRYLTIRAKRSSVLFGKFMAQSILLVGMVLLVDLGVFVYAKLNHDDFALGSAAKALLRFWPAAALFSLTYLALTSLCSTLFRSPALSLVTNFLVLFSFWLLDALGRASSSWAWLRFVSPSHYATDLLHPALNQFAVSVGAYAVFAAAFLGAAYAVISWRDL
jgi:ABC-type transport system involved in multi-copper enzyme maturation permease subunit